MIQVTITCDTLDELSKYLRLGATPVTPAKQVQKEVAAEAVLQSASTGGSAVAEEQPQELKSDITVEQIRALVGSLSKTGKREKCKELLTEFGAENVKTLKAEHYASFYKRLNEL